MSSQPTQGGNRGGRNGGAGPRTRSQQAIGSAPAPMTPPAPMRAPDSLPPQEPVAASVGGPVVVPLSEAVLIRSGRAVPTHATAPAQAPVPAPTQTRAQASSPNPFGPRMPVPPQHTATGCIYSPPPPQRPAGQPAASAPSPPAPQQEKPRGMVQGEEVDEQRAQESKREQQIKAEETLLRAIIRQRKEEFEREQEARLAEQHAKQLAVLEAKKAAERYIEENRRRREEKEKRRSSESSFSTDAFRGRRRTSNPSDSSRSRSPISRRPLSPITCRPPSPMTRRSRSPMTRRSRSPMTRRSRSPITRRSRSPMTRRSRSPMTRRSRSPTTRRRSPSPMAHRSFSSQRDEIKARRQEVQLRIEQSNLEALLLAWEKQELENELTRIEIARLRSLIERESADPEQGTNADGSGPSTSSGHRSSASDCRRRDGHSDDDCELSSKLP